MSTVDKQLETVRATIDDVVPREITISDVTYEGPELVIYTRDPKQFARNGDLVRELASELRKRITVRPDPDVLTPPSRAEEEIRSVVPDEAEIADMEFYADTGEVVIRASKPGVVIGQSGETLRQITQRVGWTPEVVRTPPIESATVQNVRNLLRQEREDRRDVLERVGRQIHREPMSDDEYVRITMLGGCREIGRNAFILSTPDSRILVDCGDAPGSSDQPYLEIPEAFGAGANGIDAVVLTHAHLDHSALIPKLFEYGYDGPIYCTEPTRDLMGLLTLDALDRPATDGRSPPYDSERVRDAIKHTITLEYGDVTDIAPDVKLTLHDAGHVVGSAITHFHIGDGLYDGATNEFPRVETLVMESTYGGRNDYQTDREDAERKLLELVSRTHDRDGTVVLPSPAVGRSQELMLVLEEAMRNGDVPEMPVYLDGMIWEATAVHTTYPEYLRDDLRNRIFDEADNPFLADAFEPVDGQDRESLADDGPAVVLAPDGMVTGGPVHEWIELLADDPDSTLAMLGYQARGTLGRRIRNGWDELPIGDAGDVDLEMDVRSVDGFSGHADRQGLENFVRTMNPSPEKVLCVHGDESASQDLSSALYHDHNLRTFAPQNLETFRFV